MKTKCSTNYLDLRNMKWETEVRCYITKNFVIYKGHLPIYSQFFHVPLFLGFTTTILYISHLPYALHALPIPSSLTLLSCSSILQIMKLVIMQHPPVPVTVLKLNTRWRRIVSFTLRQFYPQEIVHGTQRIEGWINPRASLDVGMKRKIPEPTGNPSPSFSPQPVTTLTELYQFIALMNKWTK